MAKAVLMFQWRPAKQNANPTNNNRDILKIIIFYDQPFSSEVKKLYNRMPAILKSKHRQFCNWLQDIKSMQPATEHKLNELEDELEYMYKNYHQKLDELKLVIHKYQEKQKAIKNEIKRIRKFSLISHEKEKINNFSF